MQRPNDEFWSQTRPQSDLLYWLYRHAYIAVLPAELHSSWAACYRRRTDNWSWQRRALTMASWRFIARRWCERSTCRSTPTSTRCSTTSPVTAFSRRRCHWICRRRPSRRQVSYPSSQTMVVAASDSSSASDQTLPWTTFRFVRIYIVYLCSKYSASLPYFPHIIGLYRC